MREPPVSSPQRVGTLRITPACAGTTSHDCRHNQAGKDHPRVCGNHKSGLSAVHPRPGSPPRVREPHERSILRKYEQRITPACAGTTPSRRTARKTCWDHPRVCGNHQIWGRQPYLLRGSPPRVREPQVRPEVAFDYLGITPACAGTTNRGHSTDRGHEDHPRVCGNHARISERSALG